MLLKKDKGKSTKSSKGFPSGDISDREARGRRRKDYKEKRIKRKRSYSPSSDSYSSSSVSDSDSESETNHLLTSLVFPVMGSVGRGGQQRDTKADAGKERPKDEMSERRRRNKDERVGHDKAKKSKKAKDGGKLSTAVPVGNAADSSPAEKNFSRE